MKLNDSSKNEDLFHNKAKCYFLNTEKNNFIVYLHILIYANKITYVHQICDWKIILLGLQL